jgi:hypothetical protein
MTTGMSLQACGPLGSVLRTESFGFCYVPANVIALVLYAVTPNQQNMTPVDL